MFPIRTVSRTSAFQPIRNSYRLRMELEEYIFAFEIETFLVPQFSRGWVFLAPNVNWDLLPEPNEDNYEFAFKGQLNKMFGYIGSGVYSTVFIADEKYRDLQLRGIVFIIKGETQWSGPEQKSLLSCGSLYSDQFFKLYMARMLITGVISMALVPKCWAG